MRRPSLVRLFAAPALLLCAAAGPVFAQANAPIIGRWDLTVQSADRTYPSWVEVSLSGSRTLVGRFVGGGGCGGGATGCFGAGACGMT